ncbi:MAG: DNA repair protein RecN [Eubacterium sp.]|nr:DNA repair protein RecN [Candidatus Colimonas fimequi]
MIRHIRIKNFATIENTEIDFHDGLNIITGETGAGKSIVIEAVSLALGSRADTAFVRSGADKAIVQMVADLGDEEYVITREVSSTGRNVCKVNDEIVTLGNLSKLCKSLADIHGQYDHQSLLNPEYHIDLVDLYKKDVISPAKAEVAQAYAEYTSVRSDLKKLLEELARGQRERDFMEFELKEISQANLVPGEDQVLEERIAVLQNSEAIYANLSGAYEAACGEEYSLLSGIKGMTDMLQQVSGYSQQLQDITDRLNGIYYDLEDACSSIRENRDSVVFSPEELDHAISRSEMINHLKNKHGKTLEELIEYAEELEYKLSKINNADGEKAALQAKLHECGTALKDACARLSQARQNAAADLEKLITEQLLQLNFKDAQFAIQFSPAPVFTANGNDNVEFIISTNRGEPMKPLSKIASGGEMSRIMLAFKKVIGDYDQIPTMIFDEIDSGISGIAASIVGRKLKEIADTHQIICITHLPQIAACGAHNYRIAKSSDDERTYTEVTALSDDEKTYEIARLLGGDNITDTTLASARELMSANS